MLTYLLTAPHVHYTAVCLREGKRNKVSLSDIENVNPCRLTAVECCLVLLLTV